MYPMLNPYPAIMPPTIPATQNIQYVNGKASVDAIQLPPNSSGIYVDSNVPKFYTKHTDASGAAIVKEFDFTEAVPKAPTEYVTKEEFESFKAELHKEVEDVRTE